MTKPIIGISGSVIIDDGGIFPGYHRSYVNEDYVDSVVQNEGSRKEFATCDSTRNIDYCGSLYRRCGSCDGDES
ncbi:hypothetical protein IMAU30156_01195 [Lactobacillus helveticus]|uniref:Uncharacterized protein n=1 Tax=Lactobacillus helveticus TaxID=1587 RepID=A0A9Q5CA70_LACHE|nr:hypothetical protein [Lactobacillus helveticus]NRN93238.1 hypothetical protein [Lactobacillus helveticus]NRO05754.1 hypothetical protein [Lactobacillus helveticus]NRO22476.1 hypothetical protein [Lactobacillus helveticus]NRO31570.1 hypothetical protein [Lactobacillus helveticus]